jgi:hypothetical protein
VSDLKLSAQIIAYFHAVTRAIALFNSGGHGVAVFGKAVRFLKQYDLVEDSV